RWLALSAARGTSLLQQLSSLANRPFDILGLAFLGSFMLEASGTECCLDLSGGAAVREGMDRIGQVDSRSVAAIDRVRSEAIDTFPLSVGSVFCAGGPHALPLFRLTTQLLVDLRQEVRTSVVLPSGRFDQLYVRK